ncbi:hypothetical protein A343_0136 [Porphyromonas gingivalis JCVI SC001]|nr:hypothetical protein A343_0136 [Porphyromonas gingivalis JCVI SC001]
MKKRKNLKSMLARKQLHSLLFVFLTLTLMNCLKTKNDFQILRSKRFVFMEV